MNWITLATIGLCSILCEATAMPIDTPGVMSAPNSAQIKAVVARAQQSPQFPNKWLLTIEILESQPVRGPNFAQPGKQVEAFTIRPAWNFPVPVTIEADAEYIGARQQGTFQLTNLRQAE